VFGRVAVKAYLIRELSTAEVLLYMPAKTFSQ
jgi:hypothetical protein